MSDIDSEEHEVPVDTQSVFYYVKCPFCGTEFAVWNLIKQHSLGYSATRDNDIIQLYCPICGEKFPLVVAKAPEVFLQPSLFNERFTDPEETDALFEQKEKKE